MSKELRIPLSRPDIGPLEKENVRMVMESGWLSQGFYVHQAQEKLCALTGRRFALCVSSGTSALLVSLFALKEELQPQWRPWRCAAPTLAFAAVHSAIRIAGAEVRLLGAEASTWQVPASEWERAAPHCEAFLAAPCYGMLSGMDAAASYNGAVDSGYKRVVLLEDCAESFTGSLGGKPAGSFGRVSCVSFYANKCLTAGGEGGAVLTDDEDLYRRARIIANHGIPGKDYVATVTGMNARMTDLQAAVLCAQLDRREELVESRTDTLSRYRVTARGAGWRIPLEVSGEVPAPWLMVGIPPVPRADFVAEAERRAIDTRPVFPCRHAGKDNEYAIYGCPIELRRAAEEISRTGVCLPLFSGMTEDQVDRVVDLIRWRP